METYVDEFGLIREVCGCPHFLTPGTSAESMAAYLMMWAWDRARDIYVPTAGDRRI